MLILLSPFFICPEQLYRTVKDVIWSSSKVLFFTFVIQVLVVFIIILLPEYKFPSLFKTEYNYIINLSLYFRTSFNIWKSLVEISALKLQLLFVFQSRNFIESRNKSLFDSQNWGGLNLVVSLTCRRKERKKAHRRKYNSFKGLLKVKDNQHKNV